MMVVLIVGEREKGGCLYYANYTRMLDNLIVLW